MATKASLVIGTRRMSAQELDSAEESVASNPKPKGASATMMIVASNGRYLEFWSTGIGWCFQ